MKITIVNDTNERLFCKIYAGPEIYIPNHHTLFFIFFKQRPFKDGAEQRIVELQPQQNCSWSINVPNMRIHATTSENLATIGLLSENNNEKIIFIKDSADISLETTVDTANNSDLN